MCKTPTVQRPSQLVAGYTFSDERCWFRPVYQRPAGQNLNCTPAICSDQPLLEDQSTVLAAFQQLPKLANGSVDRVTLGNFVNTYFGQAGR